jgi:hypothetical protein
MPQRVRLKCPTCEASAKTSMDCAHTAWERGACRATLNYIVRAASVTAAVTWFGVSILRTYGCVTVSMTVSPEDCRECGGTGYIVQDLSGKKVQCAVDECHYCEGRGLVLRSREDE